MRVNIIYTCIFLKGPANSAVFAGISLLFSSHTKQLSKATVCGTDKSLKTPLNINSVINNSSALNQKTNLLMMHLMGINIKNI